MPPQAPSRSQKIGKQGLFGAAASKRLQPRGQGNPESSNTERGSRYSNKGELAQIIIVVVLAHAKRPRFQLVVQ